MMMIYKMMYMYDDNKDKNDDECYDDDIKYVYADDGGDRVRVMMLVIRGDADVGDTVQHYTDGKHTLESFRGAAQKWFVDRLRLNVNRNALRRLGKLTCL
ncbi:hypothetical protein DPMN_037334 [Dreissena polymorpha]|uniref:Uncharacterized protein n=1 Tax=Dreissena polymorpha TaxID=45954 RepID=A0A9D4RP10_DREPO|nr:hypothetical protein DPMN_037334 [Dreissena polymorpha]